MNPRKTTTVLSKFNSRMRPLEKSSSRLQRDPHQQGSLSLRLDRQKSQIWEVRTFLVLGWSKRPRKMLPSLSQRSRHPSSRTKAHQFVSKTRTHLEWISQLKRWTHSSSTLKTIRPTPSKESHGCQKLIISSQRASWNNLKNHLRNRRLIITASPQM